ncbi:uncharacterized protein, partial [Palaemon carinicauda]|uniref:uncharacterized protein n=1 Tax=Palaemon carinicauda TaxID=392227 RepID=UPI0035B5A3FC
MIYGTETASMRKTEEKRIDMAEMRMLRWMSGVTREDRIRNNYIRGSTKVVEISKKVQEGRLRCIFLIMQFPNPAIYQSHRVDLICNNISPPIHNEAESPMMQIQDRDGWRNLTEDGDDDDDDDDDDDCEDDDYVCCFLKHICLPIV